LIAGGVHEDKVDPAVAGAVSAGLGKLSALVLQVVEARRVVYVKD
jgi:hypothetical protein